MKLGVGGGVDLGWKVAAALQGWGGPAQVESYKDERRPVHRAVLDEEFANYAIYVAPAPPEMENETAEGETIRVKAAPGVQVSKSGELNTLGKVLGFCYRSLITEEDSPAPAHPSAPPLGRTLPTTGGDLGVTSQRHRH